MGALPELQKLLKKSLAVTKDPYGVQSQSEDLTILREVSQAY